MINGKSIANNEYGYANTGYYIPSRYSYTVTANTNENRDFTLLFGTGYCVSKTPTYDITYYIFHENLECRAD
jgi:hypothetical protein